MTTLVISDVDVCAGGGHLHGNGSLNGGALRAFQIDVDDLRANPSAEDVLTALRVILKMHCMGMTRVQARNSLQAGITVTIEAAP
jgi:hypothetical protein